MEVTVFRTRVVFFGFVVFFFLILARLFSWQILKADVFAAAADAQHWAEEKLLGRRGSILAADGYPLVMSESAWDLFIDKNTLSEDARVVVKTLVPILATGSGTTAATVTAQLEENLFSLLDDRRRFWVKVGDRLSKEVRLLISSLNIAGFIFQPSERRVYPEASSTAHLLGFVGADAQGEDQGYYGVEGFYNGELKGRDGRLLQEKDAAGRPIIIGGYKTVFPQDGRNIRLTVERPIQFLAEVHLADALETTKASAGSIVVLNPKTGAVRAMVSLPSYDPRAWDAFPESLYRNPVIAETYEPGSTFKVFVMAKALEEGIVTRATRCTQCSGPRTIGNFVLRTWNDVYRSNATMDEIIVHSDNVGMVFVGELLGMERLYTALGAFGLLQPTGIDLQGEGRSSVRPLESWRSIDLATVSFGQGVAVTAMQMATAVSAIANGGIRMQPYVVAAIEGSGETIVTKPTAVRRVISKETASRITEMMVAAVEEGEAKWTKAKGYRIAGKTGTASIPIEGHYDAEKTIASFIGFAPAENPTFVMLVTLREPETSPWAAETAAPLFFAMAQDILRADGIPPSPER